MKKTIISFICLILCCISECSKVAILREGNKRWYVLHKNFHYKAENNSDHEDPMPQYLIDKLIHNSINTIPNKYKFPYVTKTLEFSRLLVDYLDPITPEERLALVGGVINRKGSSETFIVIGLKRAQHTLVEAVPFKMEDEEMEYELDELEKDTNVRKLVKKCSIKFIARVTTKHSRTFTGTFDVQQGDNIIQINKLIKYASSICTRVHEFD